MFPGNVCASLLLKLEKVADIKEFVHHEITSKIIGASMKVHSALGTGFQEVIYQRALCKEFTKNGLSFQREFSMPIYYDNELIGERRVDFFVDGVVIVELKAITKLENVHLAQAKNYMEVYNIEVGLLINFGTVSLEFKRLLNKKFTASHK